MLFFTAAVTLYFTSIKTQIEVENWSDPELAGIKYKYISNPTNEAYRKEYLDYKKTQ